MIGNLGWNPNGSLGSLIITDPFNPANSQTCNYTHDDLSRIASVSCGSIWSQSFGFDPFGNINKTGSQSFTPTYSNSTNQINGGGYSQGYDANGNLLTINDGTSHTYSWDAEGKQLGVDNVRATYDALGRMVEWTNAAAYTQTVYGLGGEKLALMNGQTLQKSFVATTSGTAVFTASGLSYFRHADWLGSSRFASTTSRTMYSSSAYAPFGEQYAKAGNNDQNFTGQQPDTASGLYDFLFRRLSQTQGRWISPDPAGIFAVDPTAPQTWNRYAYALNSPLEHIDPLGLDIVPCPVGTPPEVICFDHSESGGEGGGSDSWSPGNDGGGFLSPTTLCNEYNICGNNLTPPQLASDQGNSNEDGPAKNGLFSQLKDKLHDLICSAVEPLTTFANRSNKTQALGFNVSGALGLFNGVAGSYGVQVAADPTGGVALISNASGNPGFPPVFALGGMGGAAYTQSTAQTVNDLTGPSTVASFSISPEGAGPTIGLDLATSPSATSTTVSYGPGFGAKYAVTSAAGGTKIIAGTSCP